MPLLDDVGTLLATSTAFTVGSTGNLMKTILLDSPGIDDTVTVLYETAGLPVVHAFSTTTGTVNRLFERPTLEVMCRSTSYQTARANAHVVFGLLDGLNNTALNGTTYRSIAAVQSPFPLTRDDSERWIFTATYDVEKSTG